MPKHGLTRNASNEPICRCGFRPEVLDCFLTFGLRWLKAKNLILDHAEALNAAEAIQFELPRLVDQAIMHSEEPGARPGDCLRACFASITDRALLEVPHFAEYGDDWWTTAAGYIRRWSGGTHELMWFPPRPQSTAKSSWGFDPEYGIILCGPSPRGDFGHAVVGHPEFQTMLHDPHPSRDGILATEYVMALVKRSPVPAPPRRNAWPTEELMAS